MIDTSQLSNEVIPGIQEAYLSYGQRRKPVPAGTYRVRIAQILEIRPNSKFVTFQIDFQVVGEARLGDGRVTEEYNGFFISRQWVSSAPWNGRSMASDLLQSAGIATQPRFNREMEKAILQIQETGELLTVKVNWEGFSKALWDRKLMELTGATDPIQARNQATQAQKNQASRFAVRARSYRDFPDDPDGEGKLHRYTDPQTGEEVVASPKIRRFLPSRDF